MASPGNHEYDEHLLSAAPKPDRRALQEGYDPTLLNQQERRPRSSTPRQASSPTPGPASPTDRDVEKGVVASGAVAPKHGSPAPPRATPIATPTKSKPFYKTKKGLFIIAGVLVAIIIAAVVGGVVGGRKKSSSNSEAPSNGSTQGSTPDTQGQGSSSSGPISEPTSGQTEGQSGPDTGPTPTESFPGLTFSGFPTGAENGQPTFSGLPPLRRWLD